MSRVNPAAAGNTPALVVSAIARPSLTSLLLTNLRLLDFDRRHDWPQFTTSSFAADKPGKEGQLGQRTRIKSVEWALYHLFQIWNAAETREKLQPFFPPLEPLQSLNLRAALYRGLNDLKKNGVLGRESVLRKTMLDDCRGEKFLEVMVLFSTAVLRKVQAEVSRMNGQHHSDFSTKLATKVSLHPYQQDSLIALSIAHRGVLQIRLKQRAEFQNRCEKFSQQLAQKSHQMVERMNNCKNIKDAPVDDAHYNSFQKQVTSMWPGRSQWPDTILHGDGSHPDNVPLMREFPEVWGATMKQSSLGEIGAAQGLLSKMAARIQDHKNKLATWRNFRESAVGVYKILPQKMGASFQSSDLTMNFAFTEHHDLHAKQAEVLRIPDDEEYVAITEVAHSYQHVIAEMRKKLEGAKTSKSRGGLGWTSRGESTTSELTSSPLAAGASIPISQFTRGQRSSLVGNSRLNSPSEHIKNVAAQRFSPSTFFSPVKAIPAQKPAIQASIKAESTLEPNRAKDSPSDNIEMTLTPPLTPGDSESTDPVKSIQAQRWTPEERADDVPYEHRVSINNDTISMPVPLSLVERTRLSIASATIQNNASFPLKKSAISMATAVIEPIIHPLASNSGSTLLERTRQSIARVPAASDDVGLRQVPHRRRTSRQSLFPVNQFETPQPPKVVDLDPIIQSPSRNITPTDRLFTGDADVASVFRSRPKVKHSPVSTPNAIRDDPARPLEYVSIDDTGKEGDDSDIWAELAGPGSPLGGKVGRARA